LIQRLDLGNGHLGADFVFLDVALDTGRNIVFVLSMLSVCKFNALGLENVVKQNNITSCKHTLNADMSSRKRATALAALTASVQPMTHSNASLVATSPIPTSAAPHRADAAPVTIVTRICSLKLGI
jgi:hypothetical protein